MSTVLFCDNCGAALTHTTGVCTMCGFPINAASPPAPSAPASSSPAGQRYVTPTTPCTLAPGYLLARRYQIIRQLGQGGFATVYQARDRAQGKKLVAIKQIHLEMLTLQETLDANDAYNREVYHLSQLRYRHLPRIYAHFMDEQHWYIVIEYIAGQSLEDRLKAVRHHSLPALQVLDIGIVLCNTLEYLHMQRPPLIFRDVKPANIIVTRAGKPYLIDFGTTRPYRPGRKDTSPLGTPGYAAPEQYGRRAYTTPQTDIYGLGATLQTLLTGQEPLEIRQQGLPTSLGKRVPPRLLSELARMQAADATQRPRDMTEVRQSLQEIKDQFLSQKIKAAGIALQEMWKETSAFASMSLVLLFFLDIASLSGLIWSGIWPVSLLAIVAFTWVSSLGKLRDARLENLGTLALSEKMTLIWKQFTASLTFSLLLSFFSYYLFSLLNFFNIPPIGISSDRITAFTIVATGLSIGLGWALRQIFLLRARRRQALIYQRKQEILVQQTVRHRP